MGRTVYLATWMFDLYGKLVGKYTIPLDPIGYGSTPKKESQEVLVNCLIAGLIKGKQWLTSPDHKAGYFWGGLRKGGG